MRVHLLQRLCMVAALFALAALAEPLRVAAQEGERPNILLAISDDQSFPHASAYGSTFVRTPAFDRVAREGVLFMNAFVASPGCSPSRAALLTGRYPWQIEHAGTHASAFSAAYAVYPDLLEQAGYSVGYTGKGWGPGDWEAGGRTRNPAGPAFDQQRLEPPYEGISANDYAANFADFLAARSAGQPFCFWYGASEPHRVFEEGAGQADHTAASVTVPAFLPDVPAVRNDLLDYAVEIEWFDEHLGRMLAMLEEAGELENTIVIVTSDNGMAFPRAKANVYEYGIHVPLAIRWGAHVPGRRVVEEPVSLVDLAPTMLEAAGVAPDPASPLAGYSLLDLLAGTAVATPRTAAYAGRERHSSSRYGNLGYPQRAVRTAQYLFIRNLRPERWPAGSPRRYAEDGTLGPMHGAYHDIDACPTMSFLVEQYDVPALSRYLHLAVDRRPAEELYDVQQDPGCLHNLANEPAYDEVKAQLRARLAALLTRTEDPYVEGEGDVFETYERLRGPMRQFPPPEWALTPEDTAHP